MSTRMACLLGSLAVFLSASVGMVAGHHGWSGYDSRQTLQLTGTIQESGYEHPHGYLRLAVPDKVWLVGLETSGVAGAMRHWLWLYPLVEIVHIVGFVVLVGAAVMFDLRLLGLARYLPAADLAHYLLPWARTSLLLVLPSGLLLFTAHATEWAASPVFRLKLLLLAAAALNAALFHRGPFQSVATWNRDRTAPVTAKCAAVASLLLWLGVIACGRLLAYV